MSVLGNRLGFLAGFTFISSIKQVADNFTAENKHYLLALGVYKSRLRAEQEPQIHPRVISVTHMAQMGYYFLSPGQNSDLEVKRIWILNVITYKLWQMYAGMRAPTLRYLFKRAYYAARVKFGPNSSKLISQLGNRWTWAILVMAAFNLSTVQAIKITSLYSQPGATESRILGKKDNLAFSSKILEVIAHNQSIDIDNCDSCCHLALH